MRICSRAGGVLTASDIEISFRICFGADIDKRSFIPNLFPKKLRNEASALLGRNSRFQLLKALHRKGRGGQKPRIFAADSSSYAARDRLRLGRQFLTLNFALQNGNFSKLANLSQFRIAFSPKRALKGRIFYANLDARHEKQLGFAATLEGASAAAESAAIQNWA